jgi:hypothetical protein
LQKHILFLFLLLASSVYAQSHIYVGTGIAHTSEKLSSSDRSVSNTQGLVKIGYGLRNSYAVELALDYTPNHSSYFAQNDGFKYGFSVDLMKAYDLGIFINPYLKFGFGAGALQTKADLNNHSLTYGTFNSAVGFFLPLSKQFDVEMAYQYKYVSYEKIDTSTADNPTAHLHIVYAGFNIRF